MSLHPRAIGPVPGPTARVAHAAFPKGSPAIRIRDELGVLYHDEQFAPLFPRRGQASTGWRPATDQYGDPVVHVNFARATCAVCPARVQCTRSATSGRKLTLRPRSKHEALLAARQRQQTADFKARYGLRAGIEGTLAQGTRVFGLRQARYRGFPKTQLQNAATACLCVWRA